jgi:hypothetical protein
LNFHRHNIQELQELKARDLISRTNFYREFVTLLDENEEVIRNLFITDIAHFHLFGCVNKQRKPLPTAQKTVQSVRVIVCFAISSSGITGPYFFLRR